MCGYTSLMYIPYKEPRENLHCSRVAVICSQVEVALAGTIPAPIATERTPVLVEPLELVPMWNS